MGCTRGWGGCAARRSRGPAAPLPLRPRPPLARRPQAKTNDGCLQRFVQPQGESGKRFNSMIQAAWSPQMCLLERRVNVHRLDQHRVPVQDRCVTYDGGQHLSRIAPVRGQLLPDRVIQLCGQMVSHIRTTSAEHLAISRLLLHFKCDEHDRPWLLWCSSVRIAPPSRPASPLSPSTRRSLQSAYQSTAASALSASPSSPGCLVARIRSPDERPALLSAVCCAFTGAPLEPHARHHLTFKALIAHSRRLAEQGLTEVERGEVPPLLARACPELTPEQYHTDKNNPMFLFRRVRVCEEVFLAFSTGLTAGIRCPERLAGTFGSAADGGFSPTTSMMSSKSAPSLRLPKLSSAKPSGRSGWLYPGASAFAKSHANVGP